jgi:hypothetical protein
MKGEKPSETDADLIAVVTHCVYAQGMLPPLLRSENVAVRSAHGKACLGIPVWEP